jgi:HEAT repeat protein
MSRRLSTWLLAAALAGTALSQVPPLQAAGGPDKPAVQDVLGAIDFVPSRDTLTELLAPAPATGLAEIATNPGGDPGIRLRAIRGLTHFPSPEAHDALIFVIDDLVEPSTGAELLLLRAAIEALGEIGTADDVAVITPFLSRDDLVDDRNRDLRAAAANALRVIASPSAVTALRARQRIETIPQVSLAITEALRAILGGT